MAVALSQGGSIYQFYLVRAEGEHKISLAKRSMPEGVNVITVFDKEDIVTALSLPILPFFNGYNDDDIEDTLNP